MIERDRYGLPIPRVGESYVNPRTEAWDRLHQPRRGHPVLTLAGLGLILGGALLLTFWWVR